MSEYKTKRIYLDYCQKSNTKPAAAILALFDDEATHCSLVRQQDSGEEPNMDERGMLALSVVLSENLSSFQELTLTNHLLTPNMLNILAAGLQNNRSLVKLSLQNNFIGEKGVEKLLQGLNYSQSLTHLDLSCNRLCDKGAQLVASFVESGSGHLQSLSLCQNLIENDLFGDVLAYDQDLKYLDLSYNNYSAESFEALFKGLCANSSIKSLDLRGMSLAANINAIALSDLFRQNKSLEGLYVDIDFSLLDENMIQDLESALLCNTSVQSFRSMKYELQSGDELTGGIFKMLQANQWIRCNYQRLCANELTECQEDLQGIVKCKLESMAEEMKEGDALANYLSSPRTFAEIASPKDTQTSSVSRVLMQQSNRRGHSRVKSIDELMQDTNLLDLQCVDALSNRSELKSASKPPSLPKQFIDYIDSKLEPIKQQVVHTQLETEKRMQGIEEKMDLLLTMLATKGPEQKRASRVDSISSSLPKQIRSSISSKRGSLHEAFEDRPCKFEDSGAQESGNRAKLRTVEADTQADPQKLDDFMQGRLNFETNAQSCFNDIFMKLHELNTMMSQTTVATKPTPDTSSSETNSLRNERERLEQLVSNKIDQIFTSRLRDLTTSNRNLAQPYQHTASEPLTIEEPSSLRQVGNRDLYWHGSIQKSKQKKALHGGSSVKNSWKENITLPYKDTPERPATGHPMSVKDLNYTPIQSDKRLGKSGVKARLSENKKCIRGKKKTPAKAELPTDIKHVKQQIKQKLESYKQEVHQFEVDKERGFSSPLSQKRPEIPNLQKIMGATPSTELVEILKNRGFNLG